MNATVATSRRERVFRRAFPPQPASARQVRTALTRYFIAVDVEETAAAQLLLCADEAFINAATHAPRSQVLVAAWVRDERLVLEVSDEGPGFDAPPAGHDEAPDLDAEHGRGLFLMHELMDRVQIDSGEHGTVVRMELRLSPAEAPLVA